jgi:hypothetical protein
MRSRRESPAASAASSMKNRSHRSGPLSVPLITPVIVTGTNSAIRGLAFLAVDNKE